MYCILGVPIDAISVNETILTVRTAAAQRAPFLISTPNLNFLIGSQKDVKFRDSLLASDLCLPDGMPLIWIARMLSLPIRTRVSGSDLFDALKRSDAQSLSVCFFGGAPGVAAQARESLNAEPTGLSCVGAVDPGAGSVEDMSTDVLLDQVNRSGADFLIAARGCKSLSYESVKLG